MSTPFAQTFLLAVGSLTGRIPALRRPEFVQAVREKVEPGFAFSGIPSDDYYRLRHRIQTECPLVGTSLLVSALSESGMSLSNPRVQSALAELSPDYSNGQECLDSAIKLESEARAAWLQNAVDPWCTRHSITRQQAMSILFEDHAYNPNNPEVALVTKDSVMNWGGQENDFYLQNSKEMETSKPFTVLASFVATGELKSYLVCAPDSDSAFRVVAADHPDKQMEFLVCLKGHQTAPAQFDYPGEGINEMRTTLERMELLNRPMTHTKGSTMQRHRA